jgi:hypothetical protein
MEHALTGASLFWLFVPMPLLIVFSIISVFKEKARNSTEEKSSSGQHR